MTANQVVFMTVDGTHFRIYEPTPFQRGWYSHKFNKAGLTYEVALNVRTGDICWVFGGYRAGISDLQMTRWGLHSVLPPNEKVIADKGYSGQAYRFITPPPDDNHPMGKYLKLIMARHEVINKIIKDWGSMSRVWWHGWRAHNLAFNAVAQLTQIRMENGEPFPAPFENQNNILKIIAHIKSVTSLVIFSQIFYFIMNYFIY